MKIRKLKRQYFWRVKPASIEYRIRDFKKLNKALSYIRSMPVLDALCSTISREVKGINFSCTLYEKEVWYNNYSEHNEPFKFVFKNVIFRNNSRYIFRHKTIDKSTVRYFTKSNKIFNLMMYIDKLYKDGKEPSDNNLKNIIKLFKYRFGELPDNPDGYGEKITTLKDCEWWYWSDRCGYERASVIIKCIRNEKPYLLDDR